MKFKLIFSAALFAGVISASAAASTTMATNVTPAKTVDGMTTLFGDPVIVKAKGFEIKRSELDEVVSGARAKASAVNQQLPQGFEVSILNSLITFQVLLQKANAAEHAAAQVESDVQFTNMVAQMGREDFDRQLKIVGMTEAALRAKSAQEITAMKALKRELNLNVTDAEVRSYYSNHAAKFELPEMVHTRHIMLATIDLNSGAPLSTNAVAAKRKLAGEILARAKGKDDFADLAKQYSEDQNTKAIGGEMPKFGRDQLPPQLAQFESAAFSLKPGQISDVVESQVGLHIVKLLEKIPAKKYGLMDTITISPTLSKTPAAICKEQLEELQTRERAPAFVEKMRAEAGVEIVDPALKAQSAILEAAAKDAATAAPGLGQ